MKVMSMRTLPKPYLTIGNRLFMDVEASGLHPDLSYPIQIALVDDALNVRHDFLIRPMAHWRHWSDEAESIHGISRQRLEAEGIPAEEAVQRLMALGKRTVFLDDGENKDRQWITKLFADCGGLQKPFEFRHFKSGRAGGDTLGVQLEEGESDRLVSKVFKHPHSAVNDAMQLAARWRIREDAEFRAEVKAAANRIAAEEQEPEVPTFST